jgi:hypothetical protein
MRNRIQIEFVPRYCIEELPAWNLIAERFARKTKRREHEKQKEERIVAGFAAPRRSDGDSLHAKHQVFSEWSIKY